MVEYHALPREGGEWPKRVCCSHPAINAHGSRLINEQPPSRANESRPLPCWPRALAVEGVPHSPLEAPDLLRRLKSCCTHHLRLLSFYDALKAAALTT